VHVTCTCKIEHLQNICKHVLESREVDGSKTFLQMFYYPRGLCDSDVSVCLSRRLSHAGIVRRLYVFGSSVRAALRVCVRLCVLPCVRDSRGSFMFPRYLQYLLPDFRQTFVAGASWDTDDLITFLDRKVKDQGHTIAAEAHSTRRHRRVQLFLVIC